MRTQIVLWFHEMKKTRCAGHDLELLTANCIQSKKERVKKAVILSKGYEGTIQVVVRHQCQDFPFL